MVREEFAQACGITSMPSCRQRIGELPIVKSEVLDERIATGVFVEDDHYQIAACCRSAEIHGHRFDGRIRSEEAHDGTDGGQ